MVPPTWYGNYSANILTCNYNDIDYLNRKMYKSLKNYIMILNN